MIHYPELNFANLGCPECSYRWPLSSTGDRIRCYKSDLTYFKYQKFKLASQVVSEAIYLASDAVRASEKVIQLLVKTNMDFKSLQVTLSDLGYAANSLSFTLEEMLARNRLVESNLTEFVAAAVDQEPSDTA